MTVKEALEFYLDNPDKKYVARNSRLYATATPGALCFDRPWVLHNVGQNVNGTSGTADAD
jgi:hypothetical protein